MRPDKAPQKRKWAKRKTKLKHTGTWKEPGYQNAKREGRVVRTNKIQVERGVRLWCARLDETKVVIAAQIHLLFVIVVLGSVAVLQLFFFKKGGENI